MYESQLVILLFQFRFSGSFSPFAIVFLIGLELTAHDPHILFLFLPLTAVYDERKKIDAESKKAAAAKIAKEAEEKPKAPTVEAQDLGIITGEEATPVAVAVAVAGSKRKPNKTDKASDDFFYEKFKKRARDSWRYQWIPWFLLRADCIPSSSRQTC